MSNEQKQIDSIVADFLKEYIAKLFTNISMQFSLALVLSMYKETELETAWKVLIDTLTRRILEIIPRDENFDDIQLSPDLKNTLYELGVFVDYHSIIRQQIEEFENNYKKAILDMTREFHRLRKEKILDVLRSNKFHN